MKNVGYSNESIRMQANLMGDAPASEMEWNEPFFRDCIAEKKIDFGAVMFKSVETRFASQVSMTERVLHQKKVFKA